MRVPKRARAPGAPPRDARRPRGASRRRRWIPPSAAACSLLEVGQVEELEAPVALDRAVDEGHVVDCRAGSVSAGGPPRARPRPAPPLPAPTRTSRDQQQEAGHEEDGAGDTYERGGGAGSGQGGFRAGLRGHCLGKSHSPR